LDVAKAREKLANRQTSYLKVARANASEDKILKAKNNADNQKKILLKQKNEVLEKEKDVRKKENKLADLKKELSLVFAEREKIRHPGVVLAG